MPYRILKGTVSVEGKKPDGDTISFSISDNSRWIWPKNKNGRFPEFNNKYEANVRLEAIDALELHYTDILRLPQLTLSQPKELALSARDRFLGLMGFDITYFEESQDHKLSDKANQRKPVNLAYNAIDQFGRIVGFIFPDNVELGDKPEVNLTPDVIRKSINAKLLEEGYVYPTFYGALYPALRQVFADIAAKARHEKRGIWQHHQDVFEFERQPSVHILEELVMMPKLFRRLATHLGRNGAISNFRGFLQESKDLVVDTRDVRLADFSSFIRCTEMEGGAKFQLRLTHLPEELVFANG
jgi:endonuclease YncB( thermonuclease family)